MEDSQKFQLVMQLIDYMNVALDKLEEAYNNKNSENFSKAKNEIVHIQKKISEMID